MSGVRLGDPAGCSRLGGLLRSRAAEVAGQVRELRSTAVDDPRLERRLGQAEALAESLDRLGAAVQSHAQQITELSRAHQRLEDDVRRAGLVMDDWQVDEPAGPVPADAAVERRRHQAQLQRRATAFAADVARSRTALSRTCDEAQRTLAALATSIIDG